MRYKIIKGCRIDGDTKRINDIVDLEDQATINLLTGQGQIEEYREPPKPVNKQVKKKSK